MREPSDQGGDQGQSSDPLGAGCPNLTYFADEQRHLVCRPYSVDNLHRMAADLGIKRCWFHASKRHKHYDIPKRRLKELLTHPRVTVVSPRDILKIILGVDPAG